MLKFPPVSRWNKVISYTNSCITEYLSCHIYNILELQVQETLLRTYTDKRDKEKVVVDSKDFTVGETKRF